MRDCKANAVFAELREHVCECQCGEALEFVDVDEKVTPLGARSVRARVGRETYGRD